MLTFVRTKRQDDGKEVKGKSGLFVVTEEGTPLHEEFFKKSKGKKGVRAEDCSCNRRHCSCVNNH